MLKLLRWDNLQRIAYQPERIDTKELLDICHQIFLVQGAVGVASFIPAAFSRTLGLETVLNVLIPFYGRQSTREPNPGNYKAIRVAAVYWLAGACWGLLQCIRGREPRALPKALGRALLSAAQWLALARLWRRLQDEQISKARFFLNVVVLNKRDAVKAGLNSSMGLGEKVGTGSLGRLACALANRMVTDQKLCTALAAKLAESIPETMRESGITASATLQFQRGSLLVLQVAVEAVDVRRLVAQRLGEAKALKLGVWHDLLPARFQRELSFLLLSKTAAGLMQKLPESVAGQLKEVGGVDVAVEARSSGEEAEYLFQLLAQLDKQEAEEET